MPSPMRIESAEEPSKCEKLIEYLAMLDESETFDNLNTFLATYRSDRCASSCGVRGKCGEIFRKKINDCKGQMSAPINTIEAEA